MHLWSILSKIDRQLSKKKKKRERILTFENFDHRKSVSPNWTPKYIFPRLLNILGLGLPSILDPVIELWREGERAKRSLEGQRGWGRPSEQEREGMDFELTGGIRKPCTYSVSSGTTTLVWRSPAPSEVDKSRGVFFVGPPLVRVSLVCCSPIIPTLPSPRPPPLTNPLSVLLSVLLQTSDRQKEKKRNKGRKKFAKVI